MANEAARQVEDGEGKRVGVQIFFRANGQVVLRLPRELAERVMNCEADIFEEVVESVGASGWDEVLNAAEWELEDAIEVTPADDDVEGASDAASPSDVGGGEDTSLNGAVRLASSSVVVAEGRLPTVKRK